MAVSTGEVPVMVDGRNTDPQVACIKFEDGIYGNNLTGWRSAPGAVCLRRDKNTRVPDSEPAVKLGSFMKRYCVTCPSATTCYSECSSVADSDAKDLFRRALSGSTDSMLTIRKKRFFARFGSPVSAKKAANYQRFFRGSEVRARASVVTSWMVRLAMVTSMTTGLAFAASAWTNTGSPEAPEVPTRTAVITPGDSFTLLDGHLWNNFDRDASPGTDVYGVYGSEDGGTRCVVHFDRTPPIEEVFDRTEPALELAPVQNTEGITKCEDLVQAIANEPV